MKYTTTLPQSQIYPNKLQTYLMKYVSKYLPNLNVVSIIDCYSIKIIDNESNESIACCYAANSMLRNSSSKNWREEM